MKHVALPKVLEYVLSLGLVVLGAAPAAVLLVAALAGDARASGHALHATADATALAPCHR